MDRLTEGKKEDRHNKHYTSLHVRTLALHMAGHKKKNSTVVSIHATYLSTYNSKFIGKGKSYMHLM